MKRCLNELSKQELINLICHIDQDMNPEFKVIDCPICGEDDTAKHWTICDECNKIDSVEEIKYKEDIAKTFNEHTKEDVCLCGRDLEITKTCPICDVDLGD